MATSLVYDFVPEWFILNTFLVAAVILLVTNGALALLGDHCREPLALWSRRIGLGLCLWFTLIYIAVLSLGLWVPTRSVFFSWESGLSDLRPVGVSFGHHYDCTPSEFWFGSDR